MAEGKAGVAKKDSPYNDERFDAIFINAHEIYAAVDEIRDALNRKLNALVGSFPKTESDKPDTVQANGWLESMVYEQNDILSICKDIQERLNAL